VPSITDVKSPVASAMLLISVKPAEDATVKSPTNPDVCPLASLTVIRHVTVSDSRMLVSPPAPAHAKVVFVVGVPIMMRSSVGIFSTLPSAFVTFGVTITFSPTLPVAAMVNFIFPLDSAPSDETILFAVKLPFTIPGVPKSEGKPVVAAPPLPPSSKTVM